MTAIRIGVVAGIPIFVSPWFALVLVWATWVAPSAAIGVLWSIALFMSLIVHELGHGLVARHFKLRPQVLLHAWGGLCAHERASRPRDAALIIIAGPGAGFVFGGLVFALTRATERVAPAVAASPVFEPMAQFLLFINLVWGFVNLLPIWPLDGGQLLRLGLMRITTPLRAERISASIGLALSLAGVAAGLALNLGPILLILAMMFAWQNYLILRGAMSTGPVYKRNPVQNERLASARRAFAEGDYETSARLCHQLRAEPNIPEAVLLESWRILGLSTYRLGRAREAIGYLKRARLDADVAAAWHACLVAEGRDDEAESLASLPAWKGFSLGLPAERAGEQANGAPSA